MGRNGNQTDVYGVNEAAGLVGGNGMLDRAGSRAVHLALADFQAYVGSDFNTPHGMQLAYAEILLTLDRERTLSLAVGNGAKVVADLLIAGINAPQKTLAGFATRRLSQLVERLPSSARYIIEREDVPISLRLQFLFDPKGSASIQDIFGFAETHNLTARERGFIGNKLVHRWALPVEIAVELGEVVREGGAAWSILLRTSEIDGGDPGVISRALLSVHPVPVLRRLTLFRLSQMLGVTSDQLSIPETSLIRERLQAACTHLSRGEVDALLWEVIEQARGNFAVATLLEARKHVRNIVVEPNSYVQAFRGILGTRPRSREDRRELVRQICTTYPLAQAIEADLLVLADEGDARWGTLLDHLGNPSLDFDKLTRILRDTQETRYLRGIACAILVDDSAYGNDAARLDLLRELCHALRDMSARDKLLTMTFHALQRLIGDLKSPIPTEIFHSLAMADRLSIDRRSVYLRRIIREARPEVCELGLWSLADSDAPMAIRVAAAETLLQWGSAREEVLRSALIPMRAASLPRATIFVQASAVAAWHEIRDLGRVLHATRTQLGELAISEQESEFIRAEARNRLERLAALEYKQVLPPDRRKKKGVP